MRRGVHVVDFDNEGGARQAVEHLVAAGRRRIATIAGPQDQSAPIDRLAGWRKTLLDAGLDPAGLAEEGDFTLAGGANAMSALLSRRPDLDAVFVASDMMAVGDFDLCLSQRDCAPADTWCCPMLSGVNPGRERMRGPEPSRCPVLSGIPRAAAGGVPP